jgi:phosphohistidine phosphatase
MKMLLLLRHAKSSWKDSNIDDHERRLKKRGRKEARKMGRLIAAESLMPEAIVSSSARRCRQTADHIVHHSDYRGEVRLTPELYDADVARLSAVAGKLNDQAARVMLIGHNPGLEEFLESLVGEHTPLGTCALAQVELPIDRWADLSNDTRGTLIKVWEPREGGS